MKIYIIAGTAKSGKDKFGMYLKSFFEQNNQKVCLLRFTKPLYDYAKEYFNWDGNLNKKPRTLLQYLGYDLIQQQLGKKYFLADRLLEDIDILKNFFDVFIITDGRLISEFQRVKEKYQDVKIIRIIRNDFDNGLTVKEKAHFTENNLNEYNEYFKEVHNISEDILYQEAKKLVEEEVENK